MMNTNFTQVIEKIERTLSSLDVRIRDAECFMGATVDLENKQIMEAMREQITLEHRIEPLKATVIGYCKELESLLDAQHGLVWQQLLNSSHTALTPASLKTMVETDPDYRTLRGVSLKGERLHGRVDALMSVANSRKFTLQNLSKLIVAGAERTVL